MKYDRLACGPSRRRLVIAAALAVFTLCLHTGVARAGTLTIEGPEHAEVSIGAKPLGALPLAGAIDLEPGSYVVRCHPRGYRNFEMTVNVTGPRSEHIVRVALEPYRRRDVLGRGLAFAGLGQHYIDRPLLGWTLAALEATGITLAISGDVSMRDRRDEYRERYAAYRIAVAESDIIAAREAVNDSWRRLEDAQDRRRRGAIIAVSAVGAGLLDGLLRFPGPELRTGDVRSALGLEYGGAAGFATDPGTAGVRLTWRTHF